MSVPFSYMMPHPVTRASWSHQGSQLLAALGSAAGPTERPIVSVLWGSIVEAASEGPAQDGQLPLGVVLAFRVGGILRDCTLSSGLCRRRMEAQRA